MNIDQLFKSLNIERPKAKENKKSTTMHEAKKNRLARTRVRIFKKVYDTKQEKLLEGTLVRDHIKATIILNECPLCEGQSEFTGRIEVWSRGNLHNEERWRQTSLIRGKGMFDFHKDLPIRTSGSFEYNICPKCLWQEEAKRNANPR